MVTTTMTTPVITPWNAAGDTGLPPSPALTAVGERHLHRLLCVGNEHGQARLRGAAYLPVAFKTASGHVAYQKRGRAGSWESSGHQGMCREVTKDAGEGFVGYTMSRTTRCPSSKKLDVTKLTGMCGSDTLAMASRRRMGPYEVIRAVFSLHLQQKDLFSIAESAASVGQTTHTCQFCYIQLPTRRYGAFSPMPQRWHPWHVGKQARKEGLQRNRAATPVSAGPSPWLACVYMLCNYMPTIGLT